MALNPQERAERREAFHRMGAAEKMDYVLTYYRLPLLLALALVCALVYGFYQYTVRREVRLYAAFVNVTGETAAARVMSLDYVSASGGDPRREEIFFYEDLFLSEGDFTGLGELSRTRLAALIGAEQLDVVIMDRAGYQWLSRGGYLMELPEALARYAPDADSRLAPFLTEDRDGVAMEGERAPADGGGETGDPVAAANALNASGAPLFQEAGFPEEVYLGVIVSTPRQAEAVGYLAYLMSETPSAS